MKVEWEGMARQPQRSHAGSTCARKDLDHGAVILTITQTVSEVKYTRRSKAVQLWNKVYLQHKISLNLVKHNYLHK